MNYAIDESTAVRVWQRYPSLAEKIVSCSIHFHHLWCHYHIQAKICPKRYVLNVQVKKSDYTVTIITLDNPQNTLSTMVTGTIFWYKVVPVKSVQCEGCGLYGVTRTLYLDDTFLKCNFFFQKKKAFWPFLKDRKKMIHGVNDVTKVILGMSLLHGMRLKPVNHQEAPKCHFSLLQTSQMKFCSA